MATDTPSSSDPDSDPGEKRRPEKPRPGQQPRIALRKLPPGQPQHPSAKPSGKPPDPPQKSEEGPPKPPPRKPRHLGKRPANAVPEAAGASLSAKKAEKGGPAPARKPRHFGIPHAEKENRKEKKAPKKEKRSTKRPLFLLAFLAIIASAFLVPWNPFSPFSEGKETAPARKEEGAPLPAKGGGEATAPLSPDGKAAELPGTTSEPVLAVKEGGPEPQSTTIAGLLEQLRTVSLHVSIEPRGLFIDRVFYPLDSVIDPKTGLRLISVQPDIRQPVAVFLTPDGEPHSLPLPEKRP
jgi:hypothetical protein